MNDWATYAELMGSNRAIYMGGPFEANASWGMFCHDVAQWELMGHGALMVDDLLSGECHGQVAINNGPLFPEHELGWLVYEKAQGRGIAFEASVALRDWGFKTLKLDTLVSYVSPQNVRSRALAEKLGAKIDESALKHDPEDLVYRHANPF